MMNALALSLLVSSLAAAGMFSPTPPKQGANTIVKEGHRVVVVEYDQDGHQNTKISISPPEPDHSDSNLLDNARDKIKEAASVFPNMAGEGMGASSSHSQDAFLHAPKELICDAYGRCKHKIADAMGKAKDKAQEAIEKKKDIDGAVADAVGKAKDTVYEKARESVEIGKDTGQAMKDHVVRNVSEATHTVKRFASSALGPLDSSVMGVANLLGFATAYGMCVWITFISSYVLSKAMPRQQFVVVQSKIYPVYFRAMAYTVGIALLGHVLGHRNTLFNSKPEMLQAYNLLASLLTIFFNSLYLEPRATKVMFERMKLEKEEGRGREDISGSTQEHERTPDPKTPTPITAGTGTSAVSPAQGHDAVRSRMIKLNNKLKRLNSHSSLLNILNLMSLTWHLVYLAQRVHSAC